MVSYFHSFKLTRTQAYCFVIKTLLQFYLKIFLHIKYLGFVSSSETSFHSTLHYARMQIDLNNKWPFLEGKKPTVDPYLNSLPNVNIYIQICMSSKQGEGGRLFLPQHPPQLLAQAWKQWVFNESLQTL